MTKTIVIGAQTAPQTKIPIVFEKYLRRTGEWSDAVSAPETWNYIELIARNHVRGADLMFGYNDPHERNPGYLYLGKWNDGIV